MFKEKFLPLSFKEKVYIPLRRNLTQLMQTIAMEPQSERKWKQFILLPYIFFTTSKVDVQSQYLELLKTEQGWDGLAMQNLYTTHKPPLPGVYHIPLPPNPPTVSTELQPSRLHQTVAAMVRKGCLSKAMDRLTAKSIVLDDPSTDNVVQLLLSKHPQGNQGEYGDFPIRQARQTLGQLQVDAVDTLRVSSDDVRDIVSNLADSKLPGVDLFTAEHLKFFMGTRGASKDGSHLDADEQQFADAYTTLINLLLAGLVPDSVCAFFRTNLLLALPKSNSDVRPIGVGTMLRKVASKLVFRESWQFNKEHFKKYQLALQPAGMEEVIHMLNTSRSIHPDWDLFSIDAENAFNSANKFKGLGETHDKFPKAFPLLKQMYLDGASQFVYRDGKVRTIPSNCGFHQGDVLGTWCYIMSLQPLLEALGEHLEEEFPGEHMCVLFYVDDGNLCGPHHMVVSAVKFLLTKGPQYGYRIKSTKGAYLMGRCESLEVAMERYETLTAMDGQLRLSTDIVMVHPDNLINMEDALVALPPKYADSTFEQCTKSYGVKVLGSFLGTDQYINSKLNSVVSEWTEAADRLVELPMVQHRMLLFRYCFNPRPIHLLRTLPRNLSRDMVVQFQQLQLKVLRSMFRCELEAWMMDWFCLPIDRGGLGLLNYNDIHGIAHMASFFGSKAFRDGYMLVYRESVDHIATLGPFMQQLHEGLGELKAYLKLAAVATDEQVVEELERLQRKAKEADTTFQNELYLMKTADREAELELMFNESRLKMVHYKSLINETAGKWLQVFPRYKDLAISSEDYSIGLCFRYMLDIPVIRDRELCPYCRKRDVYIDRKGHHFATGCARDVEGSNGATIKAQRHANHDFLRHSLYNICRHSMSYSVEEPRHLFIDADNRTRPDLLVAFNKNLVTTNYALDLTIICPFDGAGKGNLRTTTDDCNARADKAARDKSTKYQQMCQQRQMKFVPFVVYSTGKVHKDGVRFLEGLAAQAEEKRRIPKHILYKYYLKILSVCLVRRLGHTISCRATGSFSRNYRVREAYRVGNELAIAVGGSRVYVRHGTA